MIQLTPREIVRELDRYIIGQDEAKRAVAVALRNRYRRAQLPPEIREEVTPKNILMVGPTGVGKTEIARRLAKLVDAPFVKVEATKFTEVGYVGRDVESIIRDLVEASIRLVKEQHTARVRASAPRTTPRIGWWTCIDPAHQEKAHQSPGHPAGQPARRSRSFRRRIGTSWPCARTTCAHACAAASWSTRWWKSKSRRPRPRGGDPRHRHEHERRAGQHPAQAARSCARWRCARRGKHPRGRGGVRTSSTWTAYTPRPSTAPSSTASCSCDEIDKVAGRGGGQRRPGRLPGGRAAGHPAHRRGLHSEHQVRPGASTDHVLFIAAGAFHVSKVTDLIPELQGRFPVRVDLKPLTREDYKRILTQPENALIRQYQLLLERGRRIAGPSTDSGAGRHRRLRVAGQRDRREHRRAPAAHAAGDASSTTSPSTPAAATRRRSRCPSTRNTCARCWTRTFIARTCTSTSSDDFSKKRRLPRGKPPFFRFVVFPTYNPRKRDYTVFVKFILTQGGPNS